MLHGNSLTLFRLFYVMFGNGPAGSLTIPQGRMRILLYTDDTQK